MHLFIRFLSFLGRSFFQTMGNEIMNYLGFGSSDYDDYDEENEYFYPNFEANVLGGGPVSSYSVYNPYDNFPDRDRVDRYLTIYLPE